MKNESDDRYGEAMHSSRELHLMTESLCVIELEGIVTWNIGDNKHINSLKLPFSLCVLFYVYFEDEITIAEASEIVVRFN